MESAVAVQLLPNAVAVAVVVVAAYAAAGSCDRMVSAPEIEDMIIKVTILLHRPIFFVNELYTKEVFSLCFLHV